MLLLTFLTRSVLATLLQYELYCLFSLLIDGSFSPPHFQTCCEIGDFSEDVIHAGPKVESGMEGQWR